MAAYMHMGHDTENLVGEKDLEEFSGIILSPVNRPPKDLKKYCTQFREKGTYDLILDPQLYFPRALRGYLTQQPYFPPAFDTVDPTSNEWWDAIINPLVTLGIELGVNAIASPTICPTIGNDAYYARCVEVSNLLSERLAEKGIRTLTSLMVNMAQLVDPDTVLRIASIITSKKTAGYYLVIMNTDELTPRREYADPVKLFGVMNFINEISSTKMPILVSHCSSDMLLFKAAGATHCATGKFFNLRRFTKSRYEEPAQGGGQLPYWFEQSLMAFLREGDLLRLEAEGFSNLIGTESSGNYWSQTIMENLKSEKPKPWLSLGWRQYLGWFGKTENKLIEAPAAMVNEWLRTAEKNWISLEDAPVLMDEARNNGTWLRPWRQALTKFAKQPGK